MEMHNLLKNPTEVSREDIVSDMVNLALERLELKCFGKKKKVFQNMNFDLREGYALSSFLMNSLEALDVDGTRIASIDLLVPSYLQNDFCNIVDELTGTKRKHDDDRPDTYYWKK